MTKKQVLITIPHCSQFISKDIRKNMLLSDFEILKETDLYTEQLFNIKNAYIVQAKLSRLVADMNRAPDELEMEQRLCAEGVVVSVNSEGKKVYKTPLTAKQIDKRITKYHDPFHAKVEKYAQKSLFMIDGHSMWPSGRSTKIDAGIKRPDINLGNRDYTTCTREQTSYFKKYFENLGYSVAINYPFKGRYVIGYHCSRNKRKGVPGIQLEINQSLYTNQKTLAPQKEKIKKINHEIQALVDLINVEF